MFTKHLKYVIFVGLFLVPFIPFLVSSAFFFPFIVTKAFAWRIIIEIVFAVWLLLALLDAEYRPKKSVISWTILVFLVVIGLADLLGVSPVKSLWSNFERMEGFVALLHLGMFFVVISSVFKEADWKKWWNTSLVASFLMVLYCILQIIGLKTINQGGVRVDGTLGNAIYLAVYMLFHIFIALLFMWREWKNIALRWVYGLLILAQISVLYFTATRGAILGLLGGLFVMAVLNIRNKESVLVRKASIAGLVGLIILIGGFFLIRNSSFVEQSLVLSRFSHLEGIQTQGRYYVWPLALEGVKDRPILGWGQENFTYVFQKYYTPDMFNLEPWFDRAHNIFLDWAVSGGILGLLSYLALYLALLLLIWRHDQNLTHTEKSILTGLIAAYFFHNFFVFDHLISYILFFSLLSYMHYRNGSQVMGKELMAESRVRNVALPAMAILLVLALYFINVKPIIANAFLIEAFKSAQTPGETAKAVQYFQKAYDASRLGRSEVVERMIASSITILTSNLPMEEKNAFFAFAKEAVLKEEKNSGGDARYQLMAGSFLSSVGLLEEALVHLEEAKLLMPGKQQIYFEMGAVYFNQSEPLKALQIWKVAYELAPGYVEAKVIYLVGAIYAGDRSVESEMIGKLTEREVVFDDRILNAYYASKRIDKVVSLLETRIKLDPANAERYQELIKQARG